MKYTARDVLGALVVASLAALGGVAVVLAEIDDAPGGILIGFLMVAGAFALSLRARKREP